MLKIKKSALTLIVIVAFLLGILVMGALSISILNSQDAQLASKYQMLEGLYQIADQSYYKEVDEDALMTGIYKGLFEGLDDPYSVYMTKEEYESNTVQTSSEFEGVGVSFTADVYGNLVVMNTIDDTPAEKAGIQTGDIIRMIDGKIYDANMMEEAASAMRGPSGTSVDITILRDKEKKEYSLIRSSVAEKSVSWEMLDGNVAYVRISSFRDHTADEFRDALAELTAAKAEGMVLDLRSNGGGIVDQGVKVADMLLPEGVVTYLQNRAGERTYYNSDADKTDIPYSVLINGGTASTSEILAAALKDYGTDIVGTTSYGKGIVQSVIPLKSGDAIKLTTMQYYSPKGNSIHEAGVEPTCTVEVGEQDDSDKQLEKAKELLVD